MKKIKLEELNLGNAEVLSREELKKVLGGMGSGSGSPLCDGTTCYTNWTCADGSDSGTKDCEKALKKCGSGIRCTY